MSTKTEYIHYGSSELGHIDPIRNQKFTKPFGGLWASPINAKFGWKQWCTRENFWIDKLNESFTFTLKDNAKILHIDRCSKLNNLPILNKELASEGHLYYLDFEEIQKEYDGIELHLSDEVYEDHWGLYFRLYGWDCDSILIFHQNIIQL